MIEVTKSTVIHPDVLKPIAAAVLAAGYLGVSNRQGTTVLHVEDAGQNNQIAISLLDNWNSLLVATTQTQIDADNVDTAVITIETPDAALDYYVWLDGVEYSFGEVSAVGGVCTLNLATETAGWYTVILARKSGNYATGQTIIEAVGV